MPAISVIVPVYQAERLLPQCVESVLGQTFSDWELLLVDDGSRDGSPALCDAYAAGDARRPGLHKPNGGVSSARNLGLEQARGQCIAFWTRRRPCARRAGNTVVSPGKGRGGQRRLRSPECVPDGGGADRATAARRHLRADRPPGAYPLAPDRRTAPAAGVQRLHLALPI